MFRKKKKTTPKKGVLIIEDMITDNNGIPILNYGDPDSPKVTPKYAKRIAEKKKISENSFSEHFAKNGGKQKKKRNKTSLFNL